MSWVEQKEIEKNRDANVLFLWRLVSSFFYFLFIYHLLNLSVFYMCFWCATPAHCLTFVTAYHLISSLGMRIHCFFLRSTFVTVFFFLLFSWFLFQSSMLGIRQFRLRHSSRRKDCIEEWKRKREREIENKGPQTMQMVNGSNISNKRW